MATRLGLEIQIGEVRFGDSTGLTMEEVEADPHWRQWNLFRSGTRIPNGDLRPESQTRFVAFLHRVHGEFPKQSIALFSHVDPIRSALLYY